MSESEVVYLPISEEIIASGKLRVETDRMSLYGFLSDFSLYLFIALAIYFAIDRWAAGQVAHQQFQLICIGIGMIAMGLISVDRNRAHLTFALIKIKRMKVKWIIAAANIVIFAVAVLFFVFTNKISWVFVKETIVVATWEQLIFSVALPYFIVRGTMVVFKFKNFNFFAATFATIVSGIAFGAIHTYAYNGDWGVLGYLMLMGVGIHSLGYYLPSTSIVLHAIINFSAASAGRVLWML